MAYEAAGGNFEEGGRTLSLSDFEKTGMLSAAFVLSFFVPESAWSRLCVWLARIWPILFRRPSQEVLSRFPPALVTAGRWPSARSAFAAQQARYFESILQVLGNYRPRGWLPEIDTRGVEHLEAALAGGRGAILWIPEFTFKNLITKIALHRLGYRITQLSRPSHPFSASRLGMRFINPIQRRIEDRYLAERVLITSEHELTALRLLRRRLGENGIVLIGAGGPASKVIHAPLLGGFLGLAAGPPRLARDAGCDLLPVVALRTGRGRFEVRVDAPLSFAGEDGDQAAELACRQFAALTEDYARRYPDQWSGWRRAWKPQPPAG